MHKSFDKIKRARILRGKGCSYQEIGQELSIAKSTAYLWTTDVFLDRDAREAIIKKINDGRSRAQESIKKKYLLKERELKTKLNNQYSRLKLSNEVKKILCAIFFWTEGGKSSKYYVSFINSDPNMIKVFLKLLRDGYDIDETKLRALIHIHEYHKDGDLKKFWAQITHIPITQFSRSYLKPHTKKRIREGYQGSLRIRYYDSKIAHELRMLYNILPDILGV
ncbi:hypothetical protein COT62_01815 [Candidatus Roizmanbacteria bacterium CG09_land_8_20_14_0_10_41_9]|uniref:Resolvase HTH domain-containing protein n=1 Tax=Candidatus Roizmanbacteria bacterium CG09_land_8_20_14_0_10_41_9 TaxID=1974850 RepID=A0A2H0WV51_9BACT|nr:MAG: hypothetical protein COT62_01815 [Candidatus Roizmanbacteria bacterium CG09_land_8_20_14_0_10_41_9]